MVPGAASSVASEPWAAGNEGQEFGKSGGVHLAWRAAAEVNSFGSPLPGVRAQLSLKRFAVARFERAREHA